MKNESSSINNPTNVEKDISLLEKTFGFLGEFGFWITISALIPGIVYVISGGTVFLRIMTWILLGIGGVLSFIGITSKARSKALAGLIVVIIISAVGLWVFGGNTSEYSNRTSYETTKATHQNNSDGYYNGHYTCRKGMEWGNLEIKGNVWSAQGVQEMPYSGLEEFGYSGVIRGNKLIVSSTMYGTNATGKVFAEFDGNKISSGGWTYKK